MDDYVCLSTISFVFSFVPKRKLLFRESVLRCRRSHFMRKDATAVFLSCLDALGAELARCASQQLADLDIWPPEIFSDSLYRGAF